MWDLRLLVDILRLRSPRHAKLRNRTDMNAPPHLQVAGNGQALEKTLISGSLLCLYSGNAQENSFHSLRWLGGVLVASHLHNGIRKGLADLPEELG